MTIEDGTDPLKNTKRKYHNLTQRGKEVVYECSTHENCSFKIKRIDPRDSFEPFYETTGSHSDVIKIKSVGLDDKTKEVILELYLDGVKKPNAILRAFRRRELAEPILSKLKNYLKTLSRKYEGQAKLSLGELEAKCIDSSEVPIDHDEAYVVQTSIDYDNATFTVIFSTKRLLENAARCRVLCIDATYKVTYEGFPLILAGTVDCNGHYHPITVSIVHNESLQTYKTVMQNLKDSNCSPVYLMSDAADSIKSAGKSIFGNIELLDCWTHTRT